MIHQGKKVSDLLQEGLFITQKIQVLEDKLKTEAREKMELVSQLEKVNRKPNFKKRVSIPLTLEEFDVLQKISFERNKTKSQTLRELVIQRIKLAVNRKLFSFFKEKTVLLT